MTLLGTNIPVPAGIFMPVFLIGGLFGRFVGWIVVYSVGAGSSDGYAGHLTTYALVGCVGFSAGVTHTISAAVIAVELTGNLQMLMPLLLVATVSAGITKSIGISVYDQVTITTLL